jgi:hypothetical protein
MTLFAISSIKSKTIAKKNTKIYTYDVNLFIYIYFRCGAAAYILVGKILQPTDFIDARNLIPHYLSSKIGCFLLLLLYFGHNYRFFQMMLYVASPDQAIRFRSDFFDVLKF